MLKKFLILSLFLVFTDICAMEYEKIDDCGICKKVIEGYKIKLKCCNATFHSNCFHAEVDIKSPICPACGKVIDLCAIKLKRLSYSKLLNFIRRCVSCEFLMPATIFLAGGATFIGIFLLSQQSVLE